MDDNQKMQAQLAADSGELALERVKSEGAKLAAMLGGAQARATAIERALRAAEHITSCNVEDVKALTEFFYDYAKREGS